MFRRLLRVTIKLGLIAAAGFAIAVVVKKLTAPADGPVSSPEPWPPLQDERAEVAEVAEEVAEAVATAAGESSNGDS